MGHIDLFLVSKINALYSRHRSVGTYYIIDSSNYSLLCESKTVARKTGPRPNRERLGFMIDSDEQLEFLI